MINGFVPVCTGEVSGAKHHLCERLLKGIGCADWLPFAG